MLCRYSRRVKVENSCLRPPWLKMVISFVSIIWTYRGVWLFFSSTLPLCQSGSFQTGFSWTCSGFGFISVLCYSVVFGLVLVVLVRVQSALVLFHHLQGFYQSLTRKMSRQNQRSTKAGCHDRINVPQTMMLWQDQRSTKHDVMTGSTFNETWCYDRINVQQDGKSWQNQRSTQQDVMTQSMFHKPWCYDRINVQQSRVSWQNQCSIK